MPSAEEGKTRPPEVYILYRDIRTFGMHELQYREARDLGVNVHTLYPWTKKPQVSEENGKLTGARFSIRPSGAEVLLEPDRLVLSVRQSGRNRHRRIRAGS